ncbi:MAG: bifunctional diaminohydroxyphosphoribosylaminopyrimidine deaminase/5-amino-6-(5-phosphoribosylamino)uracil reductase RibD [Chloroflexi bacterium]|nr:bifunctional diaminohydroxyphosphoribosylaminopyrimidine deaminase/5-amino-6-(5-phosphoribosylamino)uracil reductase RibD [Chloroflexota bacterium]
MARALRLARAVLGTTSPNPAVGCVIVKDGQVVGEGATQPPGGLHAERVALEQAGERARGATMYVTLEPCCHYGRTPPCTEAIIAAGIGEVRYSVTDPNPLVGGKGREALEATGIKVTEGEGVGEARQLNEAFFRWITTHMPFVTVKFAMSLDGKIATRTGDSRWITSEASRGLVHRLRKEMDAVMVGVNTVRRDDPQLTARTPSGAARARQPLRVVVDSRGTMPLSARLLREPGETIVAVTPAASKEAQHALANAGADVLEVAAEGESVHLDTLLRRLGQRDITSVLVEGGGQLIASLVEQRQAHKVMAFIAPVIIGGREAPTPVEGAGIERIADAAHLKDIDIKRIGADVLVTGYL